MIGGLQGAAKPRTVWFETLVITVGTFTLAHWASPGNPLFIGGEFPWIWLAPVLIALRYGTAPGAASVALLLAGWLGFNQARLLQNPEFPKLGFLGGFLSTLLCAEFSGFWQNRLRYLEQMNAYGEERLKELTRKYFLLHLSHDRLYENLISKPATLSDSLLRLRRLMAEQSAADPPCEEAPAFPGLQAMLALLTQTCQLTSAAVYRVAEDRVLPEILATVGSMPDLQASDPLIEYGYYLGAGSPCIDAGGGGAVAAGLAGYTTSKLGAPDSGTVDMGFHYEEGMAIMDLWVDAVAGSGAAILDTRKTTPGWRDLEKYAVRCGGGRNHRLQLMVRPAHDPWGRKRKRDRCRMSHGFDPESSLPCSIHWRDRKP